MSDRKEYRKKYYEQNKEKKKAYDKEYREKNKEKKRMQGKAYREANKEKIRLYQIEYRKNNKEDIQSKQRQRRLNNKDKIKEYNQTHKHSRSIRNHTDIHNITDIHIRKYNLRPLACSICWCEWKIEAHHPDYNKRNEVVFVCNSCHHYIHSWKIKDYKVLDLLKYQSE